MTKSLDKKSDKECTCGFKTSIDYDMRKHREWCKYPLTERIDDRDLGCACSVDDSFCNCYGG